MRASTGRARWKLSAVAAVGLACAALSAGCGGGGGDGNAPEGVEATTWATNVCGALLTWKNAVVRRSNGVSAKVSGLNDLGRIRTLYVAYLGEVVGDTGRMLTRVEAVGVPAVDRGRELRRDFLGALRPMKTAFEDAKEQAADLPIGDRSAFVSGISEQNQTLTSRLNRINSTFDRLEKEYDAPELNEAFDEVSACKAFSSS